MQPEVTRPAGQVITAVSETCPSGALGDSIGAVEHRDVEVAPVVGYAPNGPYVVRGGGAGPPRPKLSLPSIVVPGPYWINYKLHETLH
jgi:hypothetical protein